MNKSISTLLLLSGLLCTGITAHAITEIVHIGLFWDDRPSSVVLTPLTGEYGLHADGEEIAVLSGIDALQLTVQGQQVEVKSLSKQYGKFSVVKIVRKKWGSTFRIKPTVPYLEERQYFDNLTVSVLDGRLKIINNVYIEHYVDGVIESEAGSSQLMEYYKVQAVICRTYALSHLRKHESQGFNLCDQVHCQVYKSKSRYNPDIQKAVNYTKGMVLVDSDIKLITASFHSNCGGETANSEDVWKYPLPYLRSVNDTFCFNQPHATWQTDIHREEWLEYLEEKYNYPVEDSLYYLAAVNYCPEGRENNLTPLDSTIQMKTLRMDWQLNSAVFSIEEKEDSLLLTGIGFGHGVGLCQEGAMQMANYDIPYQEILHFYYTGVHLIHLSALDFFREE